MKSLEEEADLFSTTNPNIHPLDSYIAKYAYMECATNSKWVKSEIIREKMSLISNLRCSYEDTYYMDLEYDRLEKQLKELEDE